MRLPYLLDLHLPQAELTLNLLWQSTFNPWISAWEYFQGPFDFNKTPLGLLNTHISELDTYPYPSIIKWSLIYIQAANLPGYYETRTNTTIHITNSHNFCNVLSTMRVFLVYLVQQTLD
jgi:hypothetical protein